jgi:hypothetical protein
MPAGAARRRHGTPLLTLSSFCWFSPPTQEAWNYIHNAHRPFADFGGGTAHKPARDGAMKHTGQKPVTPLLQNQYLPTFCFTPSVSILRKMQYERLSRNPVFG